MQNTDKYISTEMAKSIFNNAPQGVDKKTILDEMVGRGYTFQGYNDQPKEQSTIQKLGSELKQRGSDLATAVSTVGKGMTEAKTLPEVGKVIGRGLLRSGGAVAGSVLDTLGAGVELADKATGEVASTALKAGGEAFLTTETGKKALSALQAGNESYQAYKVSNPEGAKDLEAIMDIANVVPAVKAAGAVGKGAVKVAEIGGKGVLKVADSAIDTVTPVVSTIKEVVSPITNIPSNIKTNASQKLASIAEVKVLPTETAKRAAQSGIDIQDVRVIPNLLSSPKSQELITAVKNLANGVEGADPVGVVGNLTTQAFKNLTTKAKTVGGELGTVAKNIGNVDAGAVTQSVINRLKKVSGLENLELENGILNFDNTTLANFPESIKAIANTFDTTINTAQKTANGSKLHMFRQGLFEDLGGKKKSLANLSATDENAINAIRGGIADAIEIASPEYKKLSTQYAKLTEPLNKLKKALKATDPTITEADMDLAGGLLSRRVTSLAASNPQIRTLLRAVGNATGDKSLMENIVKTQDLYNILNKYYDIAPKTGFQNLVKEGVGSDSIVGMAREAIKNVAGKSDAVRQKALEDLLKDAGLFK